MGTLSGGKSILLCSPIASIIWTDKAPYSLTGGEFLLSNMVCHKLDSVLS